MAKWFSAMQEALSPKADNTKPQKSKGAWACMGCLCSNPVTSEPPEEALKDNEAMVPLTSDPVELPPVPTREEEKTKKKEGEEEQSKHALSVALASAVAAEAAVVAAQAAAEVAHLTSSARFTASKSKEENAAIRIQTAFRGYKARRALRNLRGLVRLQSLMQSNSIKRQTANTLHCMQTMARVHSLIRSRRIRMAEENQAFQRQLLLKHEKELEKLKKGEEWDDSLQSKEQIEANLLHKQEGAMRRERALAYAFTHQWKNSSRCVNSMFMDPTNPQWGWSWLERWMAARPWESQNTADRESQTDRASVRSANQTVGGEILKAYSRRDASSQVSQRSSRPPSRQSPSTPPSKTPSVTGKLRSASTRSALEDDRSTISFQSEHPRRHSLAGLSVRDDENLRSSPSVPSYMASTESARAKSRLPSPLSDKTDADKASVSSVKKRLSFPAGEKIFAPPITGVRRHSGPPKIDLASPKEQLFGSTDNIREKVTS